MPRSWDMIFSIKKALSPYSRCGITTDDTSWIDREALMRLTDPLFTMSHPLIGADV